MERRHLRGSLFSAPSGNRSSARPRLIRCARFEPLEARHLLSAAPTLAPIADVTVQAGAPLHIALDGFDQDGDTLTFSATSTNSALSASIPEGNRSLKMSVEGFGDMLFELFENRVPNTSGRIAELAEAGFYDGLTFHRVVKDFMIQGGDPFGDGTGGSGFDFDDEFHPELQHTGRGLLSMAKSSDDTSDSQFFITAEPTRYLDFNHSIFGRLTEGDDVRQAIENVPVVMNDGGTEVSKPATPVVIDSMEVFFDNENGVLMLAAAEGSSGSADVTVTVTDTEGKAAEQTFHVIVEPDSEDAAPYLLDIDDVHTTVDTPIDFVIPAIDIDAGVIHFAGVIHPDNPDLSILVSELGGVATVTPTNGAVGVHGLSIGVRALDGNAWDVQSVPLMIHPDAPTAVELLAESDTGPSDSDGVTSLNNSASNRLWFRVSGVLEGAKVTLFAGDTEIGSATASGNSVEIETEGDSVLTDGAHAITAVQTLVDLDVDVGNRQDTVDLASGNSTALTITVDTGVPQFTSTPALSAAVGVDYTYDAQTNEADGYVTYELVEFPIGMTIDADTGLIRWTPTAQHGLVHPIFVAATDAAGHTAEQGFEIQVREAPVLGFIGPKQVAEGASLVFTASAASSNGPLAYSLDVGAPAGATIDSLSGVFTWTPGEAQGQGDYQLTVRVTDAFGLSDSETIAVTVAEVNEPPVLELLAPQQSVDEGALLQFTATATDPDLPANSLSYSLGEGAPAGASIDPQTGQFTWRPNETQGDATYQITIRVTDSAGASDEAQINVTVNELDSDPVFAAVDAPVVSPGDQLALIVVAHDPDVPAKSITYSLEPGAPQGAAVDADTGLLTWDVPDDFGWQTVDLAVRATEIDAAGVPGASGVALVRVVVFDLPGALMLSDSAAIFQRAMEKTPTGPGPELQDALLLALTEPNVQSAATLRFDFLAASGRSNRNIGDTGLFGTQIGPDTGSSGAVAGESTEHEVRRPETNQKSGKQGDDEAADKPDAAADPDQSSSHDPQANDAALAALLDASL